MGLLHWRSGGMLEQSYDNDEHLRRHKLPAGIADEFDGAVGRVIVSGLSGPRFWLSGPVSGPSWIAPSNGFTKFVLRTAGFLGVLAVYTGAAASNLTAIGSDLNQVGFEPIAGDEAACCSVAACRLIVNSWDR